MKHLIILLSLITLNACSAQKNTSETEVETEVENNQDVVASETFTKLRMGSLTPFDDMMVKLKDVTNDSRCPKGTQCIWAGEVSIVVGMYPKGKFENDVSITFSPKAVNEQNPMLLFENDTNSYYAYGLSPYPKSGSAIEKKAYEMLIKIVPKSE